MGQRNGWYLGMVVLLALALAACGGDETDDAGAAPSRALAGDTAALDEAPATTTVEVAPAGPGATPDPVLGPGPSAVPSGPEATTTAPVRAAPSPTSTTQCIDVGTFQGCPIHGGPAPGSAEDCASTEPEGPCDPGVVLWNSSVHSGPQYGEVDRAEPGQELTGVAVRLPAGSEVAFCFGEANAGCRVYAKGRADSGGTASFTFLVPGDAPPGEYVLAVHVSEQIRATSPALFVEAPGA